MSRHRDGVYTEEEIGFLIRMTFWHPEKNAALCLCIGAPSSPQISNSIVHDIDTRIDEYCLAHDITYSRYADDMSFSTNAPHSLQNVEPLITGILKDIDYPSLQLNNDKTVSTSRKHLRRVTGVTITPSGELSLGRDRKRLIRASINYFQKGALSELEARKLKGWLAYANAIEPKFLERMGKRYGIDVIQKIRSTKDRPDN